MDTQTLAYAALATVHIVLNAYDAHPWDIVTKCMLSPFLIVWTLRTPPVQTTLVAALSFCVLGDLLLELVAQPGDKFFLGGMLAFAAAHVQFIRIFLRRISRGGSRLGMYLPPVTAVAVALVSRTWNGLEPDLRIPVMVYGAMLGCTTVTALATGDLRAGIGAAIFMISDSMILLDVTKDSLAPKPAGVWIMATYASAIYLLTAGILGGSGSNEMAATAKGKARRAPAKKRAATPTNTPAKTPASKRGGKAKQET